MSLTPRDTDSPARAEGADEGAARNPARVLTTWKEIASHLDVSVRTAQRWRRERDLPVHDGLDHHPWATVGDLDAWRTEERTPSWQRHRLAVIGLVLVAVASTVGGALYALLRPGVPASVSFEGDEVRVLDERGRVCWTHELPGPQTPSDHGLGVAELTEWMIQDLDGDGRTDVLVNYLPKNDGSARGNLTLFTTDGSVRWQIEPGRTINVAGRDHPNAYTIMRVHHAMVGGKPRLVTVAAHAIWASSQVALIDANTGDVIEEFWHPGVLTHSLLADVDDDGSQELLLAGVNNPGPGIGRPAVMVLPLPFSIAPVQRNSMMGDLSSGGSWDYVLFPRSDVSFRTTTIATITKLMFEEPSGAVVQFGLTLSKGVLTYKLHLGRTLDLEFYEWNPDTLEVHDDLTWRGQLDHRISDAELACLGDVIHLGHVPDGNSRQFDARWRACEHPRY